MVSKYKHGKVKQCRWRKVEVEDEDDVESNSEERRRNGGLEG